MVYRGQNLSIKPIGNQCAELCFDAKEGSVNIFNRVTTEELATALEALYQSNIQGLLITSAKRGFIAGADIGEFGPSFVQGPEKIAGILKTSNENFNYLEDSPFPVIVAINGFALGGGCELALACDYRIGCNSTRIGLPETKLGIIPGWGGTVRLPRLAGIETAVEWIASGREQNADAALKVGVLDAVVADELLHKVALRTLHRCVEGKLDYLCRRQQKQLPLRHNSTELFMAFTTSKAFVFGQAGKHYPAPLAAVAAMEKAASCMREEALAIETQTFIEMAQTPEALALSGLFMGDQFISKKARSLAKQSDKSVEYSAVLGAGIMGGGIAYQSALKGVPVKMKDIALDGLNLGLAEANKILAKGVERGRISPVQMGEVLNRIEPTLSYDGFDKLDIVIEAVVENPKVKHPVLKEVEEKVAKDTIIATNTSTISINYLAKILKRPENFCGMHFFNPVHAMPLVEVIRGSETSDNAIALTVAYANAMGKKAVVVKDCPGFLVNRVLFPYFLGFSMLVRDGADFQQVDRVMESWGWPMGPAYLLDVIGIDTCIHAETVLAEAFPVRMGRDYVSATEALFKAERLGQKSQQGYYDYRLDKKGKLSKAPPSEVVSELLKPHVKAAQDFSDEDIIARMMIPMVTELARCLEEGIVDTPAEADMALIYGLGFPPFKGGIFRWLDSISLEKLADMASVHQGLGELYQLTNGIQQRLTNREKYYPI